MSRIRHTAVDHAQQTYRSGIRNVLLMEVPNNALGQFSRRYLQLGLRAPEYIRSSLICSVYPSQNYVFPP